MGCFCRLLSCVSLMLVIPVLLAVYVVFIKSPPPLPKVDLNYWWGPEELKGSHDTSVRPFHLKFSEPMVKDLKDRLKNHRSWTPTVEGAGFEYGFNTDQLDIWVQYWAEKYNFTERERFLNTYPQYKTNIQGLDIHFIRVTPYVPAGVEVVPMLFLHGWPGSVREFYEALPLLTAASKDRDFAIEAIVPSLPGYGFSDAAVRPGLGGTEMGVVFRNLMKRLGFKRFYVHGGDWGSFIGTQMATLFPEDIIGLHLTMPNSLSLGALLHTVLGSFFPPLVVEQHLADRMYPLPKFMEYYTKELGYLHLQATKPDTVGVALTDSPSGLLAYILEKFSAFGTGPGVKSNPDGGLGYRWTKDQLLDNLMMYWSSASITTAMRLYAESLNKKFFESGLHEIPTSVPTWALQAKHEIVYQPPAILKYKYPNIEVSALDDGGHFLAFELPKVFAEDVLKAVKHFRNRKTVKTEL